MGFDVELLLLIHSYERMITYSQCEEATRSTVVEPAITAKPIGSSDRTAHALCSINMVTVDVEHFFREHIM